MRLEPPGPYLPAGRGHGGVAALAEPYAGLGREPDAGFRALRLGATVGALAVALLSSGDVFLLALLLGVAAADVAAGAAAALAGVAVLARWGSSSLAALAGAQAVLGPGGAVAPALLAGSSWAAAGALAVAAPRARGPAAAFGLAAGLVVAGPAATSAAHLAFRAAGGIAGAVVALAAGRWLPAGVRSALALAAGTAAIALSVLA